MLLTHTLLLLLLAVVAESKCYYLDGKEADNQGYTACGGVNTTFSTCCALGRGDICLSNGLCSYPQHYDYRAACTNSQWDGCASVCPGSKFKRDIFLHSREAFLTGIVQLEKNDTWLQVKECASNEYCCVVDSTKDCCKNGAPRFPLPSPPVKSTSPSSDKSSTPVGAIAGGAVGGVAAIAALGGLGWWLFKRKSNSKSGETVQDIDLEHSPSIKKSLVDSTPTQPVIVEADAGSSTAIFEPDSRVVHEMEG